MLIVCVACWWVGLCIIIFLCGMLVIPGNVQCCDGDSVMGKLVAMEAKILNNKIFPEKNCGEV